MSTNNSINANSTTPLPIADGGTAVSSVTVSPTASSWAGWDANKNLSANNLIEGYATTVSSATPIVLTVSGAQLQYITGSTAQTVTMPVASTLSLGMSWTIVNLSSATTTVNSSGSNLIVSLPAASQAVVTCILTSGTSATSWSTDFVLNTAGVASITGTTNEVIASSSTGAVTLSLPQAIATTSAVTFGSVTFSPTTSGIVGTTTNDNASSGIVGEWVTSNVPYSPGVSLTNATAKTMTSISLTEGDWDVGGNVIFNIGGTCTGITAAISLSNNTLPTDASNWMQYQNSAVLTSGIPVPTVRIPIESTTTVYIIAYAGFSTSTVTAAGNIWARRRR